MALVHIKDLRKSYGPNEVLKGVSLEVKQGSVVAVIGKSGSGKSTMLRTINGLEIFQAGSIEVDGTHIAGFSKAALRELRLKVGMVFQQFNLFPHLTAGENVMLAPVVAKKMPKEEARAIAKKMLEKVGLAEKFDALLLATGEVLGQRVAIARALAMSPKVLLCDEITSALDPELVNEVLNVVRQLATEGMTLIMVTHEMRFAREVGDHLVFMHQGRIHEEGVPAEVFDNPRTAELAQFVGAVNA